ncbi:MAG: hypothetical protein H5U01_02100 [Clostridia bacterium]|nr:hypothetical protein [Clostridia bacterium]MBC7346673.1 hypothetical protein [Clostridia bacterium]
MQNRDLERANRFLGAAMTGVMGAAGLAWLGLSGIREAVPDERARAALLLLVLASQMAAGAPAGWLGGAKLRKSGWYVWLAMAGAYLAPAAAWFAGFDPAWPAAWAAAAALSFCGSWAGFGLARLLERRKPR